MRNTLLCSAITTLLLCGPALADSSTGPRPPAAPGPPAAPSAGPSQMLRLTLVVRAGADARTHELAIADIGCGTITDKAPGREDQIRICSRPTAAGLLLETDWSTRTGPAEYHTRSEMLMARTGGTGEIGRVGGLRLALTVR